MATDAQVEAARDAVYNARLPGGDGLSTLIHDSELIDCKLPPQEQIDRVRTICADIARAAIEAAEAAAWCRDMERAPKLYDGARPISFIDIAVETDGTIKRLTECYWSWGKQSWCDSAGYKLENYCSRIIAWRHLPAPPDPALTQLHDGLRGETEAALGDAEELRRG